MKDFCINSWNFTSNVWSNLWKKSSKKNIKRDISKRIDQIRKARNSIWHWSGMKVDVEKIEDYYKYFLAILDSLSDEILNFLQEERYLKK